MSGASLVCGTERRRDEVRRQSGNGLDYLEVSDDQRRLTVYFLGAAPEGLTPENIRISGGRRIRDIRVTGVEVCPQTDPELDNCMVVTVDRPGDFSTYTLCLVDPPPELRFDPRYLCLEFSFKASCPTDLDCRDAPACPPEARVEPEISYLAKDYASFRSLILDRLSVVMPEWRDRHVPDLGITLVELLAYVGDHLSYRQDAVATEAYLGTARQRISVRRHARLVDYRMHEGCNARAWVHIHTFSDVTLPAEQLSFLTRFDRAPRVTGRPLRWDDLRAVPAGSFEVFEPILDDGVAELDLRVAHNEIHFYTWGDTECFLPKGATAVTLVNGPALGSGDGTDLEWGLPGGPGAGGLDVAGGDLITIPGQGGDTPVSVGGDDAGLADEGGGVPPAANTPGATLNLRIGDVLIFEEVIGPKTGVTEDADPARRHAVRLTRVEETVDDLYGQPLVEIEWAAEDALPFPFCVSVVGPAPDCALLENVSVARGNVVLADHGRRVPEPESLGCVPTEAYDVSCEREGRPSDVVRRAGRFRPVLGQPSLTFSAPVETGEPASRAIQQDPRAALPWVRLTSGTPPVRDWVARADLLASSREDNHYVVEMDDRRRAHLRFGDGETGRRPEAGHGFLARYRVGNGPAGNAGADTLAIAVTEDLFSGVELRPRNPLPARGGTAPEPVANVKLFAPHAFRRVLERAVTADDYAALASAYPGVQRAAAEIRWNGSWYEVRVAVDPFGGAPADSALLATVKRHLFRFRRIGHDLAVRPAHYVALDILLDVCVKPGFLRGHVKAALRDRFGAGRPPNGSPAFFHPDSLTFGQGISLSRLVAEAQAVPGVASVAVTRLERLFEGPSGEIANGLLPIGPLEIARVDNDPNFPENGRIHFKMRGGR